MPDQRIKGQEVSLLVTSGGELEAELTDVKQCEFTPDFEIKSQGYLGEKTNRKDEVFNGVKGNMTIHVHSTDPIDLVKKIKDRAQRNTPDVIFNISGVFFFPNGQVLTLTIPDVKFGAVPISVNDRGDFVEMKYEFEAEDFDTEEG